MKDNQVSDAMVRMRASWLAWRYELECEEVMNVLMRTKITVNESISSDYFHYLVFEPSLETALLFLKPKIALMLFSDVSMEEIKAWLEQTETLLGNFVIEIHSIEGLCGMEGEYVI